MNAERLAQVEARRKSLEQMSLQERRLTELIDQVRALLVQAVHGDDNAYEQGESVAREAIHLNPGNGPATQALYNSEMGGQIEQGLPLEEPASRPRARNAVPGRIVTRSVPGRTADRMAERPGLAGPDGTPQEVGTDRPAGGESHERRISEALDQMVDFNIEPEPLKDAIDFIAQRYQIPILLDTKALEDASVDTIDRSEDAVFAA